jgi:hypothetical protein
MRVTANRAMSAPKTTCTISSVRPMCANRRRQATMSAPATAPAPAADSQQQDRQLTHEGVEAEEERR